MKKGVFKEHLSAFLSPQWKGEFSGRRKGRIKILLSAPLSEGLKEIYSLFLKAARKDHLCVTPWGAPHRERKRKRKRKMRFTHRILT